MHVGTSFSRYHEPPIKTRVNSVQRQSGRRQRRRIEWVLIDTPPKRFAVVKMHQNAPHGVSSRRGPAFSTVNGVRDNSDVPRGAQPYAWC